MRRLAATAAMVAALVLPAMAQHPAAHGGFSGHPVSAPHGSFGSGPGSSHFGGFTPHSSPFGRYGSFSGSTVVRPSGFAPQRLGSPSGSFRPVYRPAYRPDYHGVGPDRSHFGHGWDGHDHHHRVTYGYVYGGYPYFYAPYPYPIFTGYVDPWLFGPDTYGEDADGYSAAARSAGSAPAPYPDYGAPEYGQQGYGPEYSPSRPNETPDEAPAPAQQAPARRPPYAPSGSSASPGSGQSVILIFKDGRPPQQIHNYLLTSTKLTVLDQRYREIPLEQLNVAATVAANRAAGIDFRVPTASR